MIPGGPFGFPVVGVEPRAPHCQAHAAQLHPRLYLPSFAVITSFPSLDILYGRVLVSFPSSSLPLPSRPPAPGAAVGEGGVIQRAGQEDRGREFVDLEHFLRLVKGFGHTSHSLLVVLYSEFTPFSHEGIFILPSQFEGTQKIMNQKSTDGLFLFFPGEGDVCGRALPLGELPLGIQCLSSWHLGRCGWGPAAVVWSAQNKPWEGYAWTQVLGLGPDSTEVTHSFRV